MLNCYGFKKLITTQLILLNGIIWFRKWIRQITQEIRFKKNSECLCSNPQLMHFNAVIISYGLISPI